MSDLVQIEPSVKFPVYAEPKEPLPAKMIVGTEAFDRIRRNYEIKFSEVKRAGLLGVPIQVSPYLKPTMVHFLDSEGRIYRVIDFEELKSSRKR